MAITIHYISTDKMQFHHHCITTQEVSVAHNAENLANEIEEVLNQWGIRERIYGATSVERYWNFTDGTVPLLQYCGITKV